MPKTRTLMLGPERSIRAVQAGTGPDLVLLHGAVATHADWLAGPFDRLARRFRVTALDRPGHGGSLRPRFEGTPRAQAAQIREGLEALGIGRAAIVGHSMGGLVALALAEQFPDTVAALVLIAPIAFPEPRPLEHLLLAPRAMPVAGPAFARFAGATFDRPMLEAAHALMFSPQPVPARWKAAYPWDEVLAPAVTVAEGEEAAAVLPFAPAGLIDPGAVRAPAVILTGSADRIVNPAVHARPLARLLRDARLIELEGIGHMAHHCAMDEVAAAIGEQAALA